MDRFGIRETIWSSPLYRRTRRIAADLTRPLRRIELALVFRQDLSEPVKILDAKVQIELTQASRDDVEQAASLNPSGSRRETFWWRLENDCLCFVARAASEIVAYNWVRLRPGVDDGDMLALAEGEAFHAARLRGWKPAGLVLRVRASKSGGWPIITLWGSAHPLVRLRGK